MPLQQLKFRPGIVSDMTSLSQEGGWYDGDKVRFRQGYPESIGGWQRISENFYQGTCRTMLVWRTFSGQVFTAVGTHLKMYVESGGTYNDITPVRIPLRATQNVASNAFTTAIGSRDVVVNATAHGALTGDIVTLQNVTVDVGGIPEYDLDGEFVLTSLTANTFQITVNTAATAVATAGEVDLGFYRPHVIASNAFTTAASSPVVVVNDVAHGAQDGDFVTLSGNASAVGGIASTFFNGEFQITFLTADTYSINVGTNAVSVATGGNTTPVYQVPVGLEIAPLSSGAWGSGAWGSGAWGIGTGASASFIGMWTMVAYGQQLLYGQYGGPIYKWDPALNTVSYDPGTRLSAEPGASSVPLFQLGMLVEPSARILVVFGTNGFGETTLNPLLVRWSDAEDYVQWTPGAATQAGEYPLSDGSSIVAYAAINQATIILTDASAYIMQYVGPPYVFSFTTTATNISIIGPQALVSADGIAYWMGVDKFYTYDGRSRTLDCPVSDHVFNDINTTQGYQVISGTNEGFDEVWWFYPSADSTMPDRYVLYSTTERLWSYGELTRTAWVDSALKGGPLAATALKNIVEHEYGCDDGAGDGAVPFTSFVQSSDFDIGDGHNMGFVRRILPDCTFDGSTGATPSLQLTLRSRKNPGAGYNAETTEAVTQTSVIDVEQWTEEVYCRVRGRVMALRISANTAGTKWKGGAMRLDVRPDGRR